VSRLVRAEILKLRTVRTLLWATLAMLLLVAIPVVSIAASSGATTSAGDDRSVARVAAVAVIFAVLLGISIFGAEGSNGTITQTLLVAPVRERVLAAKAIVAAALGLAFGVLAEIVVVGVAVPGVSLSVHNARGVLAGILFASAAGGVLGVGVGAIFHRQGPAVVVTLLWLLIAESILVLALRDRVKYLPAHVFAAAVAGGDSGGDSNLVRAWSGVGGAAFYAVVFLAVGAAVLSRRDV
jgi:ABC-2 type transport system permease protein